MQLLSTFVARPTENKRFAYRRSGSKPARSGARKCLSGFTLHFDRENKHSPSRFDKIIYFLSLFAVPNGCDGVSLPPGGACEPFKPGPSPFSETPAPAFKSQLHALNERKRWGGVEGESKAWTLKMWPQRPAWLCSHSLRRNPGVEPAFLACKSLKPTCI